MVPSLRMRLAGAMCRDSYRGLPPVGDVPEAAGWPALRTLIRPLSAACASGSNQAQIGAGAWAFDLNIVPMACTFAVESRAAYGSKRLVGAVESGKDMPYSKEIPVEVPMITSKLTTKAQTTIPQPVRAALRLKEGDELAYEIEENRVILTKASAGMVDDPFATFREWESDADRKAYAKL